MAKTLAGVICSTMLVSLLCLSSCGSTSTNDTSNDTATSYTDDIAGVTFELPGSWTAWSDDEMESLGVEQTNSYRQKAWSQGENEMIVFEAETDADIPQPVNIDNYLDEYAAALGEADDLLQDLSVEKKDLSSGSYIRMDGVDPDDGSYEVNYFTILNEWVFIYEYFALDGESSAPHIDDFESMVAGAAYHNAFEENDGESNGVPEGENGTDTAPDTSDEPQSQIEPTPDTPNDPQIPDGAIDWSEAGNHVGETVTIYGKVMSTNYASTSDGQPTFINIGASYPDPSCVTAVIWGDNRDAFPSPPEETYKDTTICVTGTISLYRDACQIEVKSPDEIQILS